MNKGSDHNIKKVAGAFQSSAKDIAATSPRNDVTAESVAGGCRSSAKGHAAKDKAELQQAPATPTTPSRKVDLPVDQKPAGLCEEGPGSPLRSEVNGDVNLPGSVVTPPPPKKPIREIRVIRGQTSPNDHATPPPPKKPIREISVIRGQTPYPEETRELINEALSKCVERFRFPPEERDKVRRAAELGNPFGQYLWGLVCHYDLGDHLEAWKWFSRSAAHGYHDSVRHQALLMEADLVPLKDSSRNPYSHAHQIRVAAAELYLKAAQLGNYQACFQYGMCCLEGRGALRVFADAFHWLQLSACKGYKPAQIELARLHLNPHRGFRDPLEAYIWATVSASDEAAEILAKLDAKLSREQIFAAQAEAVRRSEILKEKKFLDPAELVHLEQSSPKPEKDPPKVSVAERTGKLREWKLTDLSKLSINVNPTEKKVLIRYGKQSSRLSFSEFNQVFSPYALSLIVEQYKSCFENEPPIEYDGRTLAYSVKNGSTRPNHKVVSDFNSLIRDMFALPKTEKAFEWSSERVHRHKSLKSRIQIKVHY